MNFRRWAAGAAVLALFSVTLSSAIPAESPEQFAKIKAWEGQFDTQETTVFAMPGQTKEHTERLSGTMVLDRRVAPPAGAVAAWEGRAAAAVELESRWQAGDGKDYMDWTESGASNGESVAKLTVWANGTYEINFGDYRSVVSQNQVSGVDRGDPFAFKFTYKGRAETTTGRLALPAEGLSLSYQGVFTNKQAGPWTITASGSFTLKERELEVVIDAPACSCKTLGKNDAPLNDLTITATASNAPPGGGKFEKFEITYEGRKPQILSETLGADARIELRADEKTQPITIRAVYRAADGTRHYSERKRVRFCFLREIEMTDNPHNGTDYAFNGSAKLAIEANAELWVDGRRGEFPDIAWEIEKVGASAQDTKPGLAFTAVRFEFDGLPAKNADFGPKKITAKPAAGECECEQEKEVRVFFPPRESGNPGGGPNWLYYWAQSPAGAGVFPSGFTPTYDAKRKSCDPNNQGATVGGTYVYADDALYLTDGILDKGCATRADGQWTEGYDCYAETIRHELIHRNEMHEWYGALGFGPKYCAIDAAGNVDWGEVGKNLTKWLAFDKDQDMVPDYVEIDLKKSRGCDPLSEKSCSGVPEHLNVGDVEMNTYRRAWVLWPPCTHPEGDWSEGGKQWTRECE